jgi:hypothetical protein
MKLTKKIALMLLTGVLGAYFNDGSRTYADIPAPPSGPGTTSTGSGAGGNAPYTVTTVQSFDDGSTLTTTETFTNFAAFAVGDPPVKTTLTATESTDGTTDPSAP